MISTNGSLTFFTLHFSIVISLRTSVCDAKLDLVREKSQKSQEGRGGGGIVDCSGPHPELKLVMEDLETSDTTSPEYPLSHPHSLSIGTSHGRLRNLGYDQFGIPPSPRLLIQDWYVETTVSPRIPSRSINILRNLVCTRIFPIKSPEISFGPFHSDNENVLKKITVVLKIQHTTSRCTWVWTQSDDLICV